MKVSDTPKFSHNRTASNVSPGRSYHHHPNQPSGYNKENPSYLDEKNKRLSTPCRRQSSRGPGPQLTTAERSPLKQTESNIPVHVYGMRQLSQEPKSHRLSSSANSSVVDNVQARERSAKRERIVDDERFTIESNVRRLKTVIFCIDLHDLVKISQMIKPPRLLSVLYFGLLSLFQHVLPCSNLKTRTRDWHFVQVTPHLSDNLLANVRNFRKVCCQGGITEGTI